MTKDEYMTELHRLISERGTAEVAAYQVERMYHNALRRVDNIKEQIRQLNQSWVNQQQLKEGEENDNSI